jgi:hypothetical protein
LVYFFFSVNNDFGGLCHGIPSLFDILKLKKEMTIPREIYNDIGSFTELKDTHPNANLLLAPTMLYRLENGFEIIEFGMPDDVKKQRRLMVNKDPKTGCYVVVFIKVGCLSNFSLSLF